jgi:hypothetical protein
MLFIQHFLYFTAFMCCYQWILLFAHAFYEGLIWLLSLCCGFIGEVLYFAGMCDGLSISFSKGVYLMVLTLLELF